MPGPNTPAITFFELDALIAADTTLPCQKRSEWRSALKRYAKASGRSLAEIIADPAHISFNLNQISWSAFGISKRSGANIEYRIRAALTYAGIDVDRRRNLRPSAEWRARISVLPKRRQEDIGRFAGFCTARGYTPDDDPNKMFREYAVYCEESVIARNTRDKVQAARKAWNRLPGVERVENIGARRWESLKVNQLPEQLQDQLADFERWSVDVDIDDLDDDRAALSPTTARNYAKTIPRIVSRLVDAGEKLEDLDSLQSLLETDRFNRLFKSEMDRIGITFAELKHSGHATLHSYVAALSAVARYTRATEQQWQALNRMRKRVSRKQTEMTAKNKELVRLLSLPENEERLLNLPSIVIERVGDLTQLNILQALEIQTAFAMLIGTKTALRIKNLAGLDLEKHIRRSTACSAGEWFVSIPAHDIKNGEAFNCKISGSDGELLEVFLTRIRPILMRDGPKTALFLNMHGRPVTPEALAKAMKKLVFKELGISNWHPHIVRAHAGWMILQENPSDHALVQDILGHKSVDTTRRYYCGLEKELAFEQFDQIVEGRKLALTDECASKAGDGAKTRSRRRGQTRRRG